MTITQAPPTVEPRSPVGEADTIVGVFFDRVRRYADRAALRRRTGDTWEAIDWAAYGEAVTNTAAALAHLGIGPHERVGVLSGNRVEWHEADLGILSAGAVTVPVYPTSASSQIAYVLGHAEARICFVENRDQLAKLLLRRGELPAMERVVLFEETDGLDEPFVLGFQELVQLGAQALDREPTLVADRARRIEPGDLATLVYTSGTTGPPKGAMITHANLTKTLRSITAVVPVGPTDRFLSFLPLSHIAERVVSDFGQIVAGGETWFARSLATVPEDLRACRPTTFFAVPRVWEKFHEVISEEMNQARGIQRRILDRYLELGAKQVAESQGEGRRSLAQRVATRGLDAVVGARIRRAAGLDAARILVSGAAPIHPDLLRWFHTIGLPVAEVYGQTEDCGPTTLNPPGRVRIGTVGLPLPGVEVRIGDDGEILVKGGNVCAGYFRDDVGTAALFDADGWMRSGDLGTLDADGYLRVTGRKKDLIITASGKNIAPQGIETRLEMEPLISKAVVIGEGKPYLTALLTLSLDELARWAEEHGEALDVEALADDPDLRSEIDVSVQRVNAERSRIEGIKRYRILPHDFTIAGDELTPTLKVKRNVVIERWSDLVEEMYAAT